jgi:ribosomal protein S18 acetylase RimI-like enzyme
MRSQGLGRALILALDDIAREEGSRKIWWETHRDNHTAQKVYDSVAKRSEFVKYAREVENLEGNTHE